MPAPPITIARDYLAVRISVPDHVVFRSFPNETVALNLRTGRYHGLDPAAGRMLELLVQTPIVATAAIQLARDGNQPLALVQADLCELCRDLALLGLVEVEAEESR